MEQVHRKSAFADAQDYILTLMRSRCGVAFIGHID